MPTARLLGLVSTLMALLSLAAAPRAQSPLHFDVLIHNGRVLDGTGNPWFLADVGIRDGRIVAVGPLSGATAERVIDATGRIVTPGFIDLHSHADDNLGRGRPTIRDADVRRKAAPNLVAQGITTVVVNQDGRSPWPIIDQRRALEEGGVGPNAILLVGHGEVRRRVMDDDVERPATEQEVDDMRALVREAMEEGAFGLSAGLEYDPGRWSTTDEVASLVEELLPWDGVYISHQRSEGEAPLWFWPSRDALGAPTLVDALSETVEIGRRTGAKVVASHIKARGTARWGSSGDAILAIERARASGVRVWADQYPYASSGSDGTMVLIPIWATGPGGDSVDPSPVEVLKSVLEDEERTRALRVDIAYEIGRRGGAERITVMDHPDRELVGKSLAEATAHWGSLDPVDAAIELQLRGYADRRGGGRLRGFSMSEADIEAFAAKEWVATASDGGIALARDGPVHARYYGTFPRKIGRYALERSAVSLAHAVRSSTSLPAVILGLGDRGLVREGMWADLVIFDPETIGDAATFSRPHQYPEGIEWVLVNGEPVVAGGELTWALPGRVIRSRTTDSRGDVAAGG